MSTSPTDQAHVDAVLAAVAGALAPLGPNYTAKDLDVLRLADADRPDDYVEVSVTRRPVEVYRDDGCKDFTGWRVNTRYVSRNYASNARLMRSRLRDTFEYVVLAIGGLESTAVQFETGDDVAPDDKWWSGLDTWTYAIVA